jgi:hypothetical protein
LCFATIRVVRAMCKGCLGTTKRIFAVNSAGLNTTTAGVAEPSVRKRGAGGCASVLLKQAVAVHGRATSSEVRVGNFHNTETAANFND